MTKAAAVSPRNPWFAAAFSLLAIGVGHIYCGRIATGLILFGMWLVHLPMLAVLAWLEPSRGAVLLLAVLPVAAHFVLYFASAIHAFWLATCRRDYTLRDYNRPLIYVALVLIGLTYPLLIAVTARISFFEAYLIPTNSMAPTIYRGERVLCNKMRFRMRPIRRGDLVVFKPPGESPAFTYVKRVIGLPGDSVSVHNGRVVLNGEALNYEPTSDAATNARLQSLRSDVRHFEEVVGGYRHAVGLGDPNAPPKPGMTIANTSFEVPEGQLFVMGDMRPMSRDSRFFGPVDRREVIGRLEYCYFPTDWTRFGVVR